MTEPVLITDTLSEGGETVKIYKATKHDLYRCKNCRHIMPATAVGNRRRRCSRLLFDTKEGYVCYRHERAEV